MPTVLYLTDLASDVSGYKLALAGRRSPSATLATAVTNVTAGQAAGNEDAVTYTAGGTAAKWITKPLLADAVIDGQVYCNLWAKESNADANVGLACNLHEYTSTEQTVFMNDDAGSTECATTIGAKTWKATAPSQTTIDAGNRLVIKPIVLATGTTGTARTCTIDYDGPTNDADGDSYIILSENLTFSETQTGSGSTARAVGLGPGACDDWIDRTNYLIGINVISGEQTVNSAIAEVGYERDLN